MCDGCAISVAHTSRMLCKSSSCPHMRIPRSEARDSRPTLTIASLTTIGIAMLELRPNALHTALILGSASSTRSLTCDPGKRVAMR